MAAVRAHPPSPRPRVVTWIAGLYAVQGLILLPLGALFVVISANELRHGRAPSEIDTFVYGVLLTTYALLALPIAYGLMRLRAWAWTLGMALQGVLLATALLQAYFGEDDVLTLAIGAFVVLCLNQQEVRVAFGVGRQDGQSR